MTDLIDLVCEIEKYCQQNSIVHRFVGGVAYTGFLNNKTTYKVDIEAKTVSLTDPSTVKIYRDDGSVRDIDLIVFIPNKKNFKAFVKEIKQLVKTKFPIGQRPFISVENAFFGNGKTSGLFQFVTVITSSGEKFGEGDVFLRFEGVFEEISWNSLEAWTLVLPDGRRITVRNPYADYLGYLVRTPFGFRSKDKNKLSLMKKLVDQTILAAKRKGVDYLAKDYYGSWLSFYQKLTHAGGTVGLKRSIISGYWSLFGTKLVHGRGGPVSQLFSHLGNKFTGTT